MKLHCLLSVLSGIAESKKSDNRGKAPREDMSQVRSHWKDAMCILEPTKCNKTCTKTLTALKGEINVTAAEYQASKHCAWTIKVPVGKEIRLQWTRMDLEWHKYCAYDKVHIVDGLSGSRLGRWCGPRYHDPVNTPWDGERRFRRVCKTSDKTNCEALDMWDTPFNTLSNEIIVAFDTDEYHQRTGFTLKWTTGDTPDLEIDGIMGADALEFVRDSIDNALIRSRDANAANSDKSRVVGLQRWNNNLYKWAIENISNEQRPNNCWRRPMSEPVKEGGTLQRLSQLQKNIKTLRKWQNFNMHNAVNLYWRIINDYVPHCPLIGYGKIKKNAKPIWLAQKYAQKYALDVSGGHGAVYNGADRDLISSSPISAIDLMELLV